VSETLEPGAWFATDPSAAQLAADGASSRACEARTLAPESGARARNPYLPSKELELLRLEMQLADGRSSCQESSNGRVQLLADSGHIEAVSDQAPTRLERNAVGKLGLLCDFGGLPR
jgi:hypothetical protein